MRLRLVLECPECGQELTPEEMAYGHDCEVFYCEEEGEERD